MNGRLYVQKGLVPLLTTLNNLFESHSGVSTFNFGSRQVTIIFVVSVCLSVCLFVQSFSQPSLIRFRSN